MNVTNLSRKPQHSPTAQRGAVLYVALIILILLALIGIIAMRVAGLQERMAGNYRATNIAFQDAETRVRQLESEINDGLYGGSGTFMADEETCQANFDPLTWADGLTVPSAIYSRRIDRCFAASSLRVGERQNEETGHIFEISVIGSDNPGAESSVGTATAVVNIIYIP